LADFLQTDNVQGGRVAADALAAAKLLADGNIKALVVQDPFRMGYEGIKTALAASKGEKVPETVDTGVNLITKENMNSERSKELLTPDVKKY
jgi:ribose transport system substrate-binding protein